MRERPSKTALYTVDAVLVTAMGNELAILLVRNSSERERWSLPWRTPQTGETLEAAAASTAEEALGESPTWMEQIGSLGGLSRARSPRNGGAPRELYLVSDWGSALIASPAARDGRRRD